jgi:hypothetical protein
MPLRQVATGRWGMLVCPGVFSGLRFGRAGVKMAFVLPNLLCQ